MDSAGKFAPLYGLRAVICEESGMAASQFHRILTRLCISVVGDVRSFESVIAVAAIERPDIVLMDVRLDDDCAGIDAARTLLAVAPTCLIFVSSDSDEEMVSAALDCGASGFVFKPVESVALGKAIAEAYSLYRTRIPWQINCSHPDDPKRRNEEAGGSVMG